jgi:molecular chaperone DnaK
MSAVGIDLGTTNSVVAHMKAGRPVVIPSRRGGNLTPSAVFLPTDGGVIVGQAARDRLEEFPDQTLVSFKRRMGTEWKTRPVNGKTYTPEELSAIVLASLKADAEAHLGTGVSSAVITVPANFNSLERQATKHAGEIAGLEVLRVVNEPTAAALAYGLMNRLSRVVVVFDLGGGTFDISVVLSEGEVYEVLFSLGDNRLGGDDFNVRILSFLLDALKREHQLDLSADRDALRLLRREAIAAKHALTDAESTRVYVPEIGVANGRRVDLDVTLDRDALRTIVKPLLTRIQNYARRVSQELAQPKYTDRYGNIFGPNLEKCDVVLVGGETRVLAVQDALRQEFAGKLFSDINPDEVVALGAAIQAGILERHTGVGGIVLVDSTSLSLGTEVKGGGFSVIIPANTPIPCRRTRNYFTVADNQTQVLVEVYQGESSVARQNRSLGQFVLENLPPRPAGKVEVAVTFDLDANDILHVEARDKENGQRAQTTIKGSQTISAEDVQRMRREAQVRAAENDEFLRINRLREESATALRTLEVRLREQRRFLQPDYVKRVEAGMAALRAAVAAGELHEIERCFYDLVYLQPGDAASPPLLALQIVANSGFRAGEWCKMEVLLENRGKGRAQDIQIVVGGESKNRRTAALAELSPGAAHSLSLSVFPESSGAAVPLALSVEYQDENRIPYVITTDVTVPVARHDHPADIGGTVIRIDKLFQHADKVNIGENIVSTHVGGDAAGQAPGPPVTFPHARGANGPQPRTAPAPGAPPATAPVECPVCATRNEAGFKFCGNCGQRLEPRPAACAKCGRAIRGQMKFCGECGAPVTGG